MSQSKQQTKRNETEKKLLYISFIEAQFKYCPITWMFFSRSCNNKINKLQERALKLVYDYESSFDVLIKINKCD